MTKRTDNPGAGPAENGANESEPVGDTPDVGLDSGKKKYAPGAGPAYGVWTCLPAEFWMSTGRIIKYIVVVLVLLLLFTLLANSYSENNWNKYTLYLVPLLILLSIIVLSYSVYRENKIRWSKSFGVFVSFNKRSEEEQLLARCKFERDGIRVHEGKSAKMNTESLTACMSNFLPRLFNLQRAADGRFGLLNVESHYKDEEAKENDQGDDLAYAWTFTCQRGPVIKYWLWLNVVAMIVVAFIGLYLMVEFITEVISNGSIPDSIDQDTTIGLILLVISMVRLLVVITRIRLPNNLFLKIDTRDNSNEVVIDMDWVEYLGFGNGVHETWMVHADAAPLTFFCRHVSSFKKKKNLNRPNLSVGREDSSNLSIDGKDIQTSRRGVTWPKILRRKSQAMSFKLSYHEDVSVIRGA